MNRTRYIDEFKNIHYIAEELGRGGQGVVFRTKDADTVIKIALKNNNQINDTKEIEEFKQKVKNLIYKPMPIDINIAKPVSILKEEAGYVMHLLSGMRPISLLFPSEVPKSEGEKLEIPDFLEDLFIKDKRAAIYYTYYCKTGGLRKRLYALSRLAIVLVRLHTRGLIYFDISHNNIFINDEEIPLVYLIDADNIEYESINKAYVYTPEYEVPEVLDENPNSLYSDIYAFGILSYLLITTTHPFKGSLNINPDWDSDDEQKEQWKLPWIEDSNDDSNKTNPIKGLRGNLTITKDLDTLFHTLFEEGKKDRYKRPTLPIWINSLEKAASKTIKCSNCEMSYYDHLFEICPYCDTKKSKRVIVKSYLFKDNKKSDERWYFVKEFDNLTKKIKLPIYLFKSFDILKIDDIFLELDFNKKDRVELIFDKNNEEIFVDNKLMYTLRKPLNLNKLNNGISIIVKDDIDITILVEIEIKS